VSVADSGAWAIPGCPTFRAARPRHSNPHGRAIRPFVAASDIPVRPPRRTRAAAQACPSTFPLIPPTVHNAPFECNRYYIQMACAAVARFAGLEREKRAKRACKAFSPRFPDDATLVCNVNPVVCAVPFECNRYYIQMARRMARTDGALQNPLHIGEGVTNVQGRKGHVGVGLLWIGS